MKLLSGALALALLAAPAAAQTTLSAQLTGAAERPNPGDLDGTGSASVTIDAAKPEVCFKLTVADIAPATMAHIHAGRADEVGGVVVPLLAPTDGASEGCVAVTAEVASAILAAPEAYFVNVHNAEFKPGAIRGQLGR